MCGRGVELALQRGGRRWSLISSQHRQHMCTQQVVINKYIYTHARTHAQAHAYTHTRTHTHTHTKTAYNTLSSQCPHVHTQTHTHKHINT